MMKMSMRLQDWQGENRAENAPEATDLHLTFEDDGLTAETDDGRIFKVELENGAIRIRGYDAINEPPVNMEMPKEGALSVDDTDYRADRTDPGPGI